MNLFQKLSLYLLTTAASVTVLVKDTGAIITSRNPPRPPVGLSQKIAQTPDSRKADRLLATPVRGVAESSDASKKVEADQLLQEAIKEYSQPDDPIFGSISPFRVIPPMEAALRLYQEIKDQKGEIDALNNLGSVSTTFGHYQQAIDYYQQGLAITRQIKDRKGETDALNNLGLVYENLKDYPKAIDYERQGLTIAREIKYRLGEIDALNRLGIIYKVQQDYKQAIDYYKQSLAIAHEIKDQQGEVMVLGNLKLTYEAQGNYRQAKEYEQQSLAIGRGAKEVGIEYKLLSERKQCLENRTCEMLALWSAASDYSKLDDYAKAIDYFQQALAIAREIKDQLKQENYLISIAGEYSNLKNYQKAIDYYQSALVISREIGDPTNESRILNMLSAAYRDLGKNANADEYAHLGNSLSTTPSYAQVYRSSEFNAGASLTLFHSGKAAQTEKMLLDAIETMEGWVRGVGYKKSPYYYGNRYALKLYSTLQQVFIAQNKIEPALEIAERSRARAFVELLASKISPNSQQKSPSPPKIEEIKQIAKIQNSTLVEYSIINGDLKVASEPQYNESELYIWVVKPTGEVTFRKTDLKPLLKPKNISLRDKVAQARQSIVKGVNVASRGNNITLTPGDRVRLKDDLPEWDSWEVISVNLQNQTITVWLPSGGTGTKSDRPMTDVVEKVTNSATANTKNSQLQEFYQLLIQPIADLLPKEETTHVIFIPQDALFLVPFPALQDPSGQYLIDKHTILTAPSIQVLDSTNKLRQKVPGSAEDVLVVGNPTMPKVSKKPGEPPQQLSALPSSEKEALAIASFWKTQALIGNQATKNTVLQKLPKTKIIHLATHGLLDDIQGLGSSIVFAPEGEDNGLLTAEDILNLYAQPQGSALSAELVVLSACDTGSGRLTGDGVIGLSRSIIAAGVPSVIVSLWSIPDAPTAELMTDFYQNLQRQQDKATALRQAMLTTKKKHPNPADWAAFTLIGESE